MEIFEFINPFKGYFPGYIISLQVAFLASLPVFFIKKRKAKKAHFILVSILFIIVLLESYGSYSAFRNNTNILYFNIFFVFLETILLCTYFNLISIRKKVNTWTLISVTVFISWFIINFNYFQSIQTQFQTNSYLFGSLILIILSGNFFYEIISFQRYSKKNLLAVPHFWVVTGVFFFYSASFMHFISLQIPDIDKDFLNAIFPFIRFLSSLMYILMGLAFYAPLIFKKDLEYQAKI